VGGGNASCECYDLTITKRQTCIDTQILSMAFFRELQKWGRAGRGRGGGGKLGCDGWDTYVGPTG